MRANISRAQEKVGVLCFSRDWHNPVQWAHYANRHEGVCLGLQIKESAVKSVRYVKDRPVIDWRKADYGDALTNRIIDCAFIKFQHWRYEDEVRALVNIASPEIERENGLFFEKFGNGITLKRVILGANCTTGRAEFVKAVGADALHGVELWKARPAFRTFRMVRQKNAHVWR